MKYRAPLRLGFFSLFLSIVLSGCVYIRLLQLKNQLADFDRNFAFETNDGVRLECLKPLLLGEDLRWLGIEPLEIKRAGETEKWHVRWIKEEPPGTPKSEMHDLELYTVFKDQKLTEVQIPERYFEFFSKILFIDLLRSTGKAHIDKLNRQADITTGDEAEQVATVLPALDSVARLLGAPTEKSPNGTLLRYRYRYLPQSPTGHGKPIEMIFYFDPVTRSLVRLVGKLPKGTLNYRFAESGKPAQPDKSAP